MNKKIDSGVTRRRLLGSGLSVGAALGLPTLIPRHVLGTETTPGANGQIVVGIIGMGVRGKQLVMNVPQSGRVAAICDADSRKTAEATRLYQANALLDRPRRKGWDLPNLG